MSAQALNTQARALIQSAVGQYDETYGFGSMSRAVYDTAWVSMVTKVLDGDGDKKYAFPESFLYLIRKQADDGSWDSFSRSCRVDSILDTAAALLALKRHLGEPLQLIHEIPTAEVERRIELATAALQRRLQDWDVAASISVGFEVIIPSMLDQLAQEGLLFDFKGKQELLAIRDAKLARFKPEYLYGRRQMSAIHSLEALVGRIDFDKVAHHLSGGAMMGSPSSTAAYLMHSSRWDDDAEAYLRHVVGRTPSDGCDDADGGVPSAFPSTYFEYTWILSTLLKAGFTSSELACEELNRMSEILTSAFRNEGGVIGFAPNVGKDVDDTAKGIVSLALLDPSDTQAQRRASLTEAMIRHFEVETHFQTYEAERDPSFSANCNVLHALLCQPNPSRYEAQIWKIAEFLSNSWWESHRAPEDKWNLSPFYNSMLVVQAFVSLLSCVDSGTLQQPGAPEDSNLLMKVSITLVQCCVRVALEQGSNGSWSDSIEQTSYGILVLSEALRLSCFRDIYAHLEKAIDLAVDFIQPGQESLEKMSSDYIWVEKVTYASPFLTQCYKLAALKSSSRARTAQRGVVNLPFQHGLSERAKKEYTGLFLQLPLLSGVPKWHLQASLIESSLFTVMCRARRLEIFPRQDMEEDRYFDMIPFIWTCANNYAKAFTSTDYLYEMMVVSFLNFQADEFMEAVAAKHFMGRGQDLRDLIDRLCLKEGAAPAGSAGSGRNTPPEDGPPEVLAPLSRFISRVLRHPKVSSASAWDQKCLRREIKTYLNAHVTQMEDSGLFQEQEQQGFGNPKHGHGSSVQESSFYHWVRTTSSDHTSAPYSFSFVGCLLSAGYAGSNPSRECFSTASQKYFAESWCRHLAIMCRMYNDAGSIARDALEHNLNSVDFPEFADGSRTCDNPTTGLATPGSWSPVAGDSSTEGKKKELLKLAEYERACLNEAERRLKEEVQASAPRRHGMKEAWWSPWALLRDVTDLHGQIYVVRDIASRMRAEGNN